MRSYSIRDAKNRLSALLARVRRGARIMITDRGVPVAVLVPPEDAGEGAAAATARLDGLVRAGLVARRRVAAARGLIAAPPVVPSRPAGGGRRAPGRASGRAVRYWDSSALLPLVVRERTTAAVPALLAADRDVLTSCGLG